MEELCRDYAQQEGAPASDINGGSSLLLRRQIEADAPGDLYISASGGHMDALDTGGHIEINSRVELLRNRMALLVRVESGLMTMEDLAQPEIRVALANEGVPAGDYARELLRSAGLWESVSQSILDFPHEPAVLRAIERALIPAAFVYGSSASSFRHDLVRELRIHPEHQPEIRYPGAVLSRSSRPERARHFLEFLLSPRAQEIFQRHGFIPVVRS